jgi:hypothetical protein
MGIIDRLFGFFTKVIDDEVIEDEAHPVFDPAVVSLIEKTNRGEIEWECGVAGSYKATVNNAVITVTSDGSIGSLLGGIMHSANGCVILDSGTHIKALFDTVARRTMRCEDTIRQRVLAEIAP